MAHAIEQTIVRTVRKQPPQKRWLGRLFQSRKAAQLPEQAQISLTPQRQRTLNFSLVKAVKKGDLKRAERLIMRGADPDARGPAPFFDPVIGTAAEKGDADMCNLLLDYGADPYARNRFFQTPRDLAFTAKICGRGSKALRALKKRGVNDSPQPGRACIASDSGVIEVRLDTNASYDGRLRAVLEIAAAEL